MISIDELKDNQQTRRLLKFGSFAFALWLLGILFTLSAVSKINDSVSASEEMDKILRAASVVKSYPTAAAVSEKDDMGAASQMFETLGLKDRVAQMSSAPSGFVVQINKLYQKELTSLVEALSGSGLSVKTAEIRAMPFANEGRLLNISVVFEGEGK